MRCWHLLSVIAVLYYGISALGISWGLPSRDIDKYLFSDGEVWSGKKIYRLANAGDKFATGRDQGNGRGRGADVDVDPIEKVSGEPVSLTATDEDIANIYLRYRLYTYQPDEMITMMALAGMRPSKLQLDPKLYQYGGLFIYPVGALIRLCGTVGLIDIRRDVVYYLDNPDEFGKFYVVARAYSAAWGLVGVLVVFAVARRIANEWAGVLAALLFAVMPVVVCMSHEGKPHLPGAVLMLLAVWFAMRCVSQGSPRATGDAKNRNGGKVLDVESPRRLNPAAQGHDWWWMCIFCGAAFGMVLSSWPIFVLIPLVAWLMGNPPHPPLGKGGRRVAKWLVRATAGAMVGVAVYLITNPYIVINLLTNRAVLASNFGNSLAMYDVSRIVEGFVRVFELTVEGATLPVLILGALALFFALKQRRALVMVLVVPAIVFFLQFVLIGAGKPAEYGRFGIFPNAALAIGAACLVTGAMTRFARAKLVTAAVLSALLISWSGFQAWGYLRGFMADAGDHNSRMNLALSLSKLPREAETGRVPQALGTLAEPAPYCFPPVDFANVDVRLIPFPGRGVITAHSGEVVIAPLETFRTPISWADKDFFDSRKVGSVVRSDIPLGR